MADAPLKDQSKIGRKKSKDDVEKLAEPADFASAPVQQVILIKGTQIWPCDPETEAGRIAHLKKHGFEEIPNADGVEG